MSSSQRKIKRHQTQMKRLQTLFLDEVADMYDAEHRIVRQFGERVWSAPFSLGQRGYEKVHELAPVQKRTSLNGQAATLTIAPSVSER